MNVLDDGHVYELKHNKDEGTDVLVFYKDAKLNTGVGLKGVTNQEVIRALIHRLKFLDEQVPHRYNKKMIGMLREILALHEARHIERLIEKGKAIENIPTYLNGHWIDDTD